ncbi:MAG: hypothetical protein KF838_07930 [Phycisphaeraceae bacterium]|nr:MAG: hypothetical protein KF838_07930 [Phycisphaeraceae bacterium]
MKKILASASVLVALAGIASADGIIVSPAGNFAVGINAGGSIFTQNSYNTSIGTLGYVGFQRVNDSYDPINPGTPTEGWAMALNGINARGDDYFLGSSGISLISESYLPSSAVIVHDINGGQARKTQRYSFLQNNVIGIQVTVTNTSGGAINSALYNREVDWDILPSFFSEFARTDALGGDVVDSSYFGFEDRDATTPFVSFGGVGGGLYGLGDLGAGMTIDLINLNGGAIADGASVTFYVFHAISQFNQSEAALRNQLIGQGATWIATGISSSGPGPFAYHAAMGYSRNLIPAPGALALLGVAGLAARRRR